MRSLGVHRPALAMNEEAPLRGFLVRFLLFLLRILFVNWPQPAANNAVTSVVDYWERVSGWVSCMVSY
jgi:hypothetical protein